MSLTVRGVGKVKIVRPYQEADKFYRCFLITNKKLTDGTLVNFEFAIKLVGNALNLAKDLKEDGSYLRILNAKLSNKKDDRFTSSYKKTQIVVYDADIISEEEFRKSGQYFITPAEENQTDGD